MAKNAQWQIPVFSMQAYFWESVFNGGDDPANLNNVQLRLKFKQLHFEL